MHVMWHLPRELPNATAVEARARRHGVGVYALGSGAAHLIGAAACAEPGAPG
jgi:GntR family transcriptional regulator/MocR family aminotransferase